MEKLEKNTVSNSLKCSLLSALVFPGLGQIMFKHSIRAFVFIIPTLACLIVIIKKMIEKVQPIIDKIANEGGTFSFTVFMKVYRSVKDISSDTTVMYIAIFVAFWWLMSVIDAYFIGKKMDEKEQYILDRIVNCEL